MKLFVLIIKILIVVALVGGIYFYYTQRELIKKGNTATELINKEKYKAATEKLETALDSTNSHLVPEHIYKKLGMAYKELSFNPSLPIKKQVKYARTALEYDPDAPVGELMRRCIDKLKKMPEVVECNRITGGDNLIMKVILKENEELETLINTLIEYGVPTTSVVLSTPIEDRIIDLTGI